MFWQLQLRSWMSVLAFDRNCLHSLQPFKRIHNHLWRSVCGWWRHNDDRRRWHSWMMAACTLNHSCLPGRWLAPVFNARTSAHTMAESHLHELVEGFICMNYWLRSCFCCCRVASCNISVDILKKQLQTDLFFFIFFIISEFYFCGLYSLWPQFFMWPCLSVRSTLSLFSPLWNPFITYDCFEKFKQGFSVKPMWKCSKQHLQTFALWRLDVSF